MLFHAESVSFAKRGECKDFPALIMRNVRTLVLSAVFALFFVGERQPNRRKQMTSMKPAKRDFEPQALARRPFQLANTEKPKMSDDLRTPPTLRVERLCLISSLFYQIWRPQAV
ncbi:MAG: hypothetical protein EHM48_07930, partial [Planctomycetaceae bacterium]